MEYNFQVGGMSCAMCAARVEKCISALPGVHEVQVNLPARRMRVVCDKAVAAQAIAEAVARAGYTALPELAKEKAKDPLKWRAICSVALLLPLVLLHHLAPGVAGGWAQLLLALPVVWLNRSFFVRGVSMLRHGSPGMDTLVSLGSGVALVEGIVRLCMGECGSAASAGMILAFVSVGKWLESRATQRTGRAVEKLSELLPPCAAVLRDGRELLLPAEEVQLGDLLIVRPGERIPADGEVTQGRSSVDESALTGESMPVKKAAGCEVTAGSVNLNGTLRVRVSRVREDYVLSGVIRLVRDAAAGKAPIARVADRLAGVFVYVVVLLACATAAAWLLAGYGWAAAAARAVAVLVVSCPCALGIATPVAIMAGAGRAAEWGVLFRSGAALELAGRVSRIALDKTGTLTQGEPCVTDVLPHECSRQELLSCAAALESGANHPIASAVLKAAAGEPLPEAADVVYLPGRGVRALVQGKLCAAGNAALMRQLGIPLQEIPALAEQGKSVLYVARDGKWLGALAVADAPRPSSAEAVRDLVRVGVQPLMVTGDNSRTARAIAARLGIDDVRAETLPADKEAIVRELQAQGLRVAMVGDGINDAPALARADVGIAFGAGTDIAMESADIILMRSDPLDIPRTIALSRATLRRIRQNLFLAFFYNILAIPLAAGAFYPIFGWLMHPAVAAAAMGLSSLCVVTNSLRSLDV